MVSPQSTLPATAPRWQFSLGRLFLVIAMFAGFMPFLMSSGGDPLRTVLVVLLLSAFAGWELVRNADRERSVARLFRASYVIARVLSEYVICVAGSFALFLAHPPWAGQPPKGFLVGLLWFLAGDWIQTLSLFLGLLFLHLLAFFLLSLLSWLAALLASFRLRRAVWLAVLHTPSVIVLVYFVIVA